MAHHGIPVQPEDEDRQPDSVEINPVFAERKRKARVEGRLLRLIQSHFDRSVSNPEEMTMAIVGNPELYVIYPVNPGRGKDLVEAVRRYVEGACDGPGNNDYNNCQSCPLGNFALLVTHGDSGEEVYHPSYCELFTQLEQNLADDKLKKGGEQHGK
jgi:hypothetical protein